MQMPVFFLSHGSPMHAIEASTAALAWAEQALHLPRPRAVLMVSAHWESDIPRLSCVEWPETIHDFGGFPAELYRLRYPAPGAPAFAEAALVLLLKAGLSAEEDRERGLDHGAWVPMMKMYPDASVPVFQLSVQPRRSAVLHQALGKALAPLREQGVLIVASGHMTHNLRDWFTARSDEVEPHALAFRNWVAARLSSGEHEALLDWDIAAPHALRAHPTAEHFLPLFVALGAAGPHARSTCFHQGFDRGALAMDAWRWD